MEWSKKAKGQYYVQSGSYRISAMRSEGVFAFTPYYNSEIIGPATEDITKAKRVAEKHKEANGNASDQ